MFSKISEAYQNEMAWALGNWAWDWECLNNARGVLFFGSREISL
jgi:hypothetical protein